ncbi:MAG: hypothetical protein ACXWKG_18495 [Limisphaerales bacterium]
MASTFSTATSKSLRSSASGTGLVPALILHESAAGIEKSGISQVDDIRCRSGIHEADEIVKRIRERVRELNAGTSSVVAGAHILYVSVTEAGISELERGGFFGASATVYARLEDDQHKELWHAEARSTSTRLRRVAEYQTNPAFYGEDFREAADDIARQLIEGPIR